MNCTTVVALIESLYIMYTNCKLHLLSYSMLGCVPDPSSWEGPSLVIKACGPLLRMPLNMQGLLPVDISACLCWRANLSFHLFRLWEPFCSLWSPCILYELVVAFVCGRSPWPMPALLDVLVGALEGEGLCPPGGVLCLSPDWALPPAVWFACPILRISACLSGLACPPGGVSASPVLFPFCRKGYVSMCRLYQSLSLYHRVVSLSFRQECINVFLWVCLYPGISPLWKKSLKLTWNCPQCP